MNGGSQRYSLKRVLDICVNQGSGQACVETGRGYRPRNGSRGGWNVMFLRHYRAGADGTGPDDCEGGGEVFGVCSGSWVKGSSEQRGRGVGKEAGHQRVGWTVRSTQPDHIRGAV